MDSSAIKKKYYHLHMEEIRHFANLAASLIGCNLGNLGEAERIVACHSLLVKYPYAYPFALELSLRLPAPMAITWLRKLRETFYAREDVQLDIDQFQIWRMQPVQAVQTVLDILESGRPFLPSTLAWLDCNYPDLGKLIRSNDTNARKNVFQKYGKRIGHFLGSSFASIGKKKLLPFYLRNGSAKSGKKLSAFLAAFALMSDKVSRRDSFLTDSLPFYDEPSQSPAPGHEQIDIVTVLWGEDYVRLWDRLNAPSLLAPGNIPALSQKFILKMVFYTRAEDAEKIRTSPVFNLIRKHASCRFIFIDDILERTAGLGLRFAAKYAPMNFCHRHAISNAVLHDKYIFINFPDMIWQNDCLSLVAGILAKGKTHIFYYPGPYLAQETAEKCFDALVQANVLSVDNRKMREICAKHRHRSTALFLPDAPLRYFGAIMLARLAPACGLAINMGCFVPLLFKPLFAWPGRSTIDDDQPLWPLLEPAKLEIIKGNSTLCAASLEKESGQDGAMRWPPYSNDTFANDLKLGMRLWNRLYFSLTERYYGAEQGDEEEWQKICSLASQEAEKIQNWNAQKLPVPPLELFIAGVNSFLEQKRNGLCTKS